MVIPEHTKRLDTLISDKILTRNQNCIGKKKLPVNIYRSNTLHTYCNWYLPNYAHNTNLSQCTTSDCYSDAIFPIIAGTVFLLSESADLMILRNRLWTHGIKLILLHAGQISNNTFSTIKMSFVNNFVAVGSTSKMMPLFEKVGIETTNITLC